MKFLHFDNIESLRFGELYEAWKDQDTEQCAVIFGANRIDGTVAVFRVLEVPNRHPDPQRHFMVRASDVPTALVSSNPIGYVHSHINGMPPSTDDLRNLRPGFFGIVIDISNKLAFLYTSQGMSDEWSLEA